MALPLSSNRRTLAAVSAAEVRANQQSALNASLAKREALDQAGTDYQPLNTDLTAIAELTPTNGDFIQRVAGAWVNLTASQTKTAIGLGNADNTADADKPVSTAQQAALDGKLNNWVSVPASASATGTAGQMAYESGFLYICVATDTWERATLNTW